jgi:NAD+ synthetase
MVGQAKRFEEDILQVPVDNLYNTYPCGKLTHYDNDAQFFYEQIKVGIKSYVEKCNFENVVIALSGGIDSALVTVLAVHALGKDKVTAITMPSKFSSEGSYKDSGTLCKNLDIPLMTFFINDMYRNFLGDFNKYCYTDTEFGIMEENLQARIRGLIIMSYSNRYKNLVLSTGNKSELSVGYCTIAGDMIGGLAPISDLYKTEVYSVAEYINKFYGEKIIPDEILNKQPSAELAPFQKDSDSLPPYDILDPILMYLIEGDSLEEEEKKSYLKYFGEYIEETQRIAALLNKAEFKRRQAAITVKVHSKAFGYGRRIPIAKTQNFITKK